MAEYGLLWFLWYRALEVRSPLPAVAITLAYAATDEFHQTFVEGRHGTPVDVLIDAAGVGDRGGARTRAGGTRTGIAARAGTSCSPMRVLISTRPGSRPLRPLDSLRPRPAPQQRRGHRHRPRPGGADDRRAPASTTTRSPIRPPSSASRSSPRRRRSTPTPPTRSSAPTSSSGSTPAPAYPHMRRRDRAPAARRDALRHLRLRRRARGRGDRPAGRLRQHHAGHPHAALAEPLAEALDEVRAEIGLDPDPQLERLAATPCFSLIPQALEDPETAGIDRILRFRAAEPHEPRPLPDWWRNDDWPLVYLTFGTVVPTIGYLPEALPRRDRRPVGAAGPRARDRRPRPRPGRARARGAERPRGALDPAGRRPPARRRHRSATAAPAR